MNVIGSVVVSVLVVAVGFLLARVTSARSDELKERIDRFGDRVDKRMGGFEKRLEAFQTSLDGLRSDLTAVALAVGARPRGGQAGSRH